MLTPEYRPHRLFLDMETGMPPVSLNSTVGLYPSEANFDNKMVIVLAALLCALMCALGLNSAIRCALRLGYSFGFGTPEQTPAPHLASNTALKKNALSRIPVITYGSGLNVTGTDCPICLGEFAEGEKVRILPKCGHGFHAKCIDTWLLSNSSCPLCRQALLDNSTSCNNIAEEVNFIVA
ncbi:RING-H2 finger protein ATL74-like [Durio zibethinus]|uniref:RING-type E3 ubiquitin transferase n=1 Tax=Durio zibethinus TaxID=66656 RepID=A0A6P5XTB1_DURZI|nr:RING-H2 finger protein ATL74-like [Durio zibethinus]